MFFNVVACCMTMQHIILQYYGFRTSYHDGIHFEKSFFFYLGYRMFYQILHENYNILYFLNVAPNVVLNVALQRLRHRQLKGIINSTL